MYKPNIFMCGTKELTQDAMFAYVAKWANSEYSDCKEYKDAQMFLKAILKEAGANYTKKIKTATPYTQWQHIDLLIEINDDLLLVIENKTSTGQHDNQLERYKDAVEYEYGEVEKSVRSKRFFVYIKSEIECSTYTKEVADAGYTYIGFETLWDIVKKFSCDNLVFQEYRTFLEQEDRLYKQWEKKAVFQEDELNFTYHDIYGLYRKLELDKLSTEWGYTSNPAGGDYWCEVSPWYTHPNPKIEYCLSLVCRVQEKDKGMRLLVKTYDCTTDMRYQLLEKLQELGEDYGFANIDKAGKFQPGENTTTAWIYYDGDNSMPLKSNGCLDYEALVKQIKNAKKLLAKIETTKL